jgi:predicted transcriptional regulator
MASTESLVAKIKALDKRKNLEHKKVLDILYDIEDIDKNMENLIDELENKINNEERFENMMDNVIFSKRQPYTEEYYRLSGQF